MNRESLRVLTLSDLHFEFHADSGVSFMASMPKDIDVLVVAGDLTNADGLRDAIPLICDSAPEVVYALGNHELYGSSPTNVYKSMERLAKKHSNLHWLDESVAVIQGQRFVGTTLWFADDPMAFRYRAGMNDFHQIKGFVPWVFSKSDKAVKFLQREVKAGDFVVTHHLPTPRSIHPMYQGSYLNPFFMRDVESLILEKKPAIWQFGHTHSSQDFVLGSTRMLVNAFGYARVEENREFNSRLILEI